MCAGFPAENVLVKVVSFPRQTSWAAKQHVKITATRTVKAFVQFELYKYLKENCYSTLSKNH